MAASTDKTYTDKQIKDFSQIGYIDLADGFEAAGGPGKKVKFLDVITPEGRDILAENHITENDCSQWNVIAVHDTNDKNGFYACVIETSPGHAVISFRGSEGLEYSYSNLKNDWMLADVGLLNSTQTTQQAEVERFLQQNKELLDQYEITLTGHSLGGNLAEYTAVRLHDYGLDDNLDRCVSLDGPGFSNEFIDKNREAINQISGKLTHYRWSLVGGLLNDLPGVEYHFADVQDVSDKDKYNSFTRHSTKYLTFKEDGSFNTGNQDVVAFIARQFSLDMDHMDKWKGDIIKYGLISTVLVAGKTIYTAKDLLDYAKSAASKVKNFFTGDKSGGGGGRSFGGGSADVIKVSTEQMADTVRRYEREKERLMEALEICNQAAQTLARSWAGPSFLEMSVRMANTYKNLRQSLDQVEDAISELKQVIQIMERAESTATATASALQAGDSPFA